MIFSRFKSSFGSESGSGSITSSYGSGSCKKFRILADPDLDPDTQHWLHGCEILFTCIQAGVQGWAMPHTPDETSFLLRSSLVSGTGAAFYPDKCVIRDILHLIHGILILSVSIRFPDPYSKRPHSFQITYR
jgi:hypothetical protein